MITAKEAREISDRVNYQLPESLINAIKEAFEKGLYAVDFAHAMNDNKFISAIEKYGYKGTVIQINHSSKTCNYLISW